MRRRAAFFSGLALVAVLLALPACKSLFGEADTPGQEAFRLTGGYVYAAIPAANYVAIGDPVVVDKLRGLEASVYEALLAARASLEGGGDTTSAGLAGLAGALASFNLQVLGSGALPDDPIELGARTIILAQVLATSAGAMRLFRKGYLRPKLKALVALGQDPTPGDWDEILAQAGALHDRIQGAP